MDDTRRNPDWAAFGSWLIATLIGWVAGLVGAILLSYLVINRIYPKETNVIVGLCMGAAVGIAQWRAARRVFPLAANWIWGVTVGMGLVFIVAVVADELWLHSNQASDKGLIGVTAAGGLLSGTLQWRALRPHSSRAAWWIIASTLSWGLAWLCATMGGPVGIVVSGLVMGAVSGAAIVWLIRTGLPAST